MKNKKTIFKLTFTLLILVISHSSNANLFNYAKNKLSDHFNHSAPITGYGYISHVVDGDTFDIKTSNKNNIKQLLSNRMIKKKYINQLVFRVRLANINTPESVHYDKRKNTTAGKKASNIVKDKFNSAPVKYTCYKKGFYGRAVCSLSVRQQDVGLWLIQHCLSKYINQYGKHPSLDNVYTQAGKSCSLNPSKTTRLKTYIKKKYTQYKENNP